MLFTTVEPISPPGVVALLQALRRVDAQAQIRVDATGRQVRIATALTTAQAAQALGDSGLSGVVTAPDPSPAARMCCGGCG
jgi:hypothetical protein